MAKEYRLHEHEGQLYVLTPSRISGESSDFLNTGMALAGTIRGRNEFQSFVDRQIPQFLRNRKTNETLIKVHATTQWRNKRKQQITNTFN